MPAFVVDRTRTDGALHHANSAALSQSSSEPIHFYRGVKPWR